MPDQEKPARIAPKDEPGYDPEVLDSGSATLESGTHILPMPSDTATVAGMPRGNRVHTEPGNPGAIAPEKQIDDGKRPGKPGG